MLYIQYIGFLGFLVYVLSYSRSTYNKVLLYQLTANFAYTVHYFLLGGISAAFVCALDMLKDLVFMKRKKGGLNCAIVFIFLYSLVTYVFYENDKEWVLKGGIATACMWLPYNIIVHSYSGIVSEIIITSSAVINLWRMKKKEQKKAKKKNKRQ